MSVTQPRSIMKSGFVHIVESPSAQDLLDGRTEGRSLSEALQLARIPFSYSQAVNIRTFEESIGQRLRASIESHRLPPILHFSAHGNSDGIGLTSGEFLPWLDLQKLLEPMHKAFGTGLLICLSACEGAQGIQMAMTNGSERPFWALVSHRGAVSWSDCAVGYIAFYNLFFKGRSVSEAVTAMNAATGDTNFIVWSGEQIKRDWLNRVQQSLTEAINKPTSSQGRGLLNLGISAINNI